MLSMQNWEELVKVLSNQGLKLFTNVKDDSELPIKGTLPIVVPLKYIITLVDYAGSAISIRCGLTDLLAVEIVIVKQYIALKMKWTRLLWEIWTTKLGKRKCTI